MTTKNTTAPTVTVCAHPDFHGLGCNFIVNITIPSPEDLYARAAERGVPSVRDRFLSESRAQPAVKRWETLRAQVSAAERRLVAAENTLKSARAAHTLLEDNPEPDLAEKLREILSRVAAAETEKAAAESDLATTKHLVPRHWIAAAQAVGTTVTVPVMLFADGLCKQRDAANKLLAEACERVAALFQRVVAEHLVQPVAEAQVWARAGADSPVAQETLAREIMAAAVGPPPRRRQARRERIRRLRDGAHPSAGSATTGTCAAGRGPALRWATAPRVAGHLPDTADTTGRPRRPCDRAESKPYTSREPPGSLSFRAVSHRLPQSLWLGARLAIQNVLPARSPSGLPS